MGLQLVAAESVDLVDNVLLAPVELQASPAFAALKKGLGGLGV